MGRPSLHALVDQHIDDACRRAVRLRDRETVITLLEYGTVTGVDVAPILRALGLSDLVKDGGPAWLA